MADKIVLKSADIQEFLTETVHEFFFLGSQEFAEDIIFHLKITNRFHYSIREHFGSIFLMFQE